MTRSLVIAKSISFILAAVMLWHVGGVRLYAQTRFTQTQQEARAGLIANRLKGIEDNRFDSLLSELRDVISEGREETKAAPEKGFAGIERLKAIKDKLATEDEKNQEYFAQLEQIIAEKKLPAEIRERHAEFVRQYQSKYDALMARLGGLESAHKTATGLWGKLTGKSQSVNWEQAIEQTTSFLDANTPQPRPRQSFDPSNLPHRSLKAEQPIPPKVTREDWLKAFPKEAAPPGLNSAPTSGPTSDKRSGANTGDSLSPLATSPPVPADLAETIEVKFTPEIRQLADSLGRNPVRIYNWVRNNIEFVPVWGSIQGAQLCLETRSCNAFDTSSLLISLLRFSSVPARYQMGTIEVPIEKFKNWAGGFTNAEAAASLFASGGTPSVVRRVNESGQVVTVRLEHVWVNAFIDYTPSGGAVNLQGDTWVELDAGFKQYTYAVRRDFNSIAAIDPQEFLAQLLNGATVDTTMGSLTNINTAALQSNLNNIVSRIRQAQAGLTPDQIANELIGRKVIRQVALSVSPAGLPYRKLTSGPSISALPANLRHSISLRLEDGFANVLLSLSLSLPEVGNKRFALNYRAASSADETALLALNGGSLPSSILVRPEFRLDEQAVGTGNPVGIGAQHIIKLSFTAPTINTPEIQNPVTAGEQIAMGLNLQNVPAARLLKDVDFFDNILQLAAANRNDEIARQKPAARVLDYIIQTWFAQTDLLSAMVAGGLDAITLRYPSAGFSFLDLEPSTLFGAVFSSRLTGISLDIDRDIVVNEARDGNRDRVITLTKQQGNLGSALEAQVPQQMFSRLPGRPTWASTTTLINTANAQGIPLFEVTQANVSAVLPRLNLPAEIESEIADAVNAGMRVRTPQQEVSQVRYQGVGYIVEDPATGSAAYFISGGLRGSGYGGPAEPQQCSPAGAGLVATQQVGADCESFFRGLLESILTELAGAFASTVTAIAALVETFVRCFRRCFEAGRQGGMGPGDVLRCFALGFAVFFAAGVATILIALFLSGVGTLASLLIGAVVGFLAQALMTALIDCPFNSLAGPSPRSLLGETDCTLAGSGSLAGVRQGFKPLNASQLAAGEIY